MSSNDSNKWDELLERSLRDEPMAPVPPGFGGRVARALDEDLRLQKAHRSWRSKAILVLAAYVAIVVMLPLVAWSVGAFGVFIEQIPGGLGMLDHARSTVSAHGLFLLGAAAVVVIACVSGVLAGHLQSRRIRVATT